jgi:hypothetical protein
MAESSAEKLSQKVITEGIRILTVSWIEKLLENWLIFTKIGETGTGFLKARRSNLKCSKN